MVSSDLLEQLEYFMAHQDELVKEYNNKFLVIKNLKVEGAYNSEIEAYREAQKKFEVGTFLIQECLEGEQCYTQTFHTPWVHA